MRIKSAGKKGKVVMESGAKDQTRPASGTSFRLRQILVPIDFSECSHKALRYALPFAREFDADLILVHVVEAAYLMGEFGTTDYVMMEADLTKEAERQLRELARAEIGSSVPWKIEVRPGRAAMEITGAARELETDLIVIATHGRTGLKHVLLGSVAENVVRHAPCPVLTVRENEREFVES